MATRIAPIWLSLIGLALLTGCGDDGAGSRCSAHDDCPREQFCCRDDRCGGGMCTYACHNDTDCPSDMRCHHEVCLFSCLADRRCAIGFACQEEGGDLVCSAD